MDDWWQQCKASVEDYRRYLTKPPEQPKKRESTWEWEDFVAAAEAYEKEHPEVIKRFNGFKF